MKTEKVLLYQKFTLFVGETGKNLKQNVSLYYCTISYYFQKQV